VTAKEKLHHLVDELSEQEADSAIELIVARHESGTVDAWGDLAKLHEATTAETLRRLAEQERAAGHAPW
jgi:hypothetical protein